MTSEEPNQVVIPFEDGKDTDDVAAVVTEVMKHNISKVKINFVTTQVIIFTPQDIFLEIHIKIQTNFLFV